MYKMDLESMRLRIEEAQKSGNDNFVSERVARCLWGLSKIRGGVALANQLIQELQLERYGAKPFVELAS